MPAAHKVHHYSNRQRAVRYRGIIPRIARFGIDSSEQLGWYRREIKYTSAWLLGCRRLGPRDERQADLLRGLLPLV